MKILEITIASGTYLVLDLPEGAIRPNIQDFSRLYYTIPQWDKSTQVENSEFEILPIGDWEYELIGPGKDHPELVEELGLLGDRTMLNSSVIAHEKAQPRIFKNPFILKKNESKS